MRTDRLRPHATLVLLTLILVASTGRAQESHFGPRDVWRREVEQVVIGCQYLRCPPDTAQAVFGDIPGLGKSFVVKEETLDRLKTLELSGRIKQLCDLRVTTISGNAAQVRSVSEVIYVTSYDADDQPTFKTREVGCLLNVTPQISSYGQLVNLTLIPEQSVLVGHDQVEITLPKSGRLTTIDVPRFVSHNLATSVAMRNGTTALLTVGTVTKDEGEDVAGQLILILLSVNIVGAD